jgi:predicted amidophosphoribosyltransferase
MERRMVGQRCANCGIDIPPGNTHCQSCGTALNPHPVVVSRNKSVLLSKPHYPTRQIKRVGASVAVGAVALLAEVGFVYLRRRLQKSQGSLLPIRRRRALPAVVEVRTEEKKDSGKRVVTVFSERVVEERRWGRPVRRIVDRLAWRSEETLD